MKRTVSLFLLAILTISLLGCTQFPFSVKVQNQTKAPNGFPWLAQGLTEREWNALLEFREEPKEPWGENDLYIYDCYGNVIRSLADAPESNAMHFEKWISTSYSQNAPWSSYRGNILGDTAKSTFELLNLPTEAMFFESLPNAQLTPYDQSDIETFIENSSTMLCILLDEDFELISYPPCTKIPRNIRYIITLVIIKGSFAGFNIYLISEEQILNFRTNDLAVYIDILNQAY